MRLHIPISIFFSPMAEKAKTTYTDSATLFTEGDFEVSTYVEHRPEFVSDRTGQVYPAKSTKMIKLYKSRKYRDKETGKTILNESYITIPVEIFDSFLASLDTK